MPENYDQLYGKQIALSFYRIKSKAAQPAPDPILYLPGGPGGGSYSAISFFLVPSFNNSNNDNLTGPRDVIAVDPPGNFPTRGGQENGISECPEAYTALYDIYSQTLPLASEYNRWKHGFSQCLARLRAQGWDFSQYHTPNLVRDLEGRVHFIPNSTIQQVTVASRDWARAVVDVQVAYETPVDLALEVVKSKAEAFYADEAWRHKFTSDPPEMLGVQTLGDFGMMIRVLFNTRPKEQWAVGCEFRRRIKLRLNAEKIEIPYPTRKVING